MDSKDNHAVTEGSGRAGMSQRLAAALAAAQVGDWEVDLASGSVALSAWSRHLLGLPSTGLVILDHIEALRQPDDPGPVPSLRDEILADPLTGFFRRCHRFRLPDGDSRWLELRGTIFRDATGRAQRLLGVMLDVTEREERAQALEQGWRRFEAALANTAVVIFEQDRNLRYTWIHNPPMGYEAYRLLGRDDVEIMGPKLGAPIAALKRQVLTTGRALQVEVTVPLGGRTQEYDLHIEPLRNSTGAVVGIACAALALAPIPSPDAGGRRQRRPATPQRTVADRDLLLDRISARLDSRQRDRGLIPICTSALERKLAGLVGLSGEAQALLAGLEAQSRYVAGKELLGIGATEGPATWLIGSGWVYSYDLFADGRRQIIGFHLPGDLIGRGPLAAGGPHLYATASDCVLCTLDQAALAEILHGSTGLAMALRAAAARDAAITEQHLVSIGRRSAEARLAHLLLELGDRLEAVQLADPGGYRCPLTQELIADALGLTNVHVNRLLRRLRDRDLLTFVRGFVAFKDKPRLIELAEYDPAYLDGSGSWGG